MVDCKERIILFEVSGREIAVFCFRPLSCWYIPGHSKMIEIERRNGTLLSTTLRCRGKLGVVSVMVSF